MDKRSKKGNQNGSTLVLVVVTLLLVGIAIVGFQTAVASFITRTATQHYEEQAYLSARSVAEAIAEKLEGDSQDWVLSLDNSEKQQIIGLDSEFMNAEQIEVTFTDAQIQLLGDVMLLSVGDSIDIGEVSFEESPDDLNTGTVTATIVRDSDSEYIIEANSTVYGKEDTIKTVVTGEFYDLEMSDNDGIQEISGNWDGFYSDFGFGMVGDGIVSNASGLYPMAVDVPLYLKTFIGELTSTEDIAIDGGEKDNGYLKTTENIYLKNVSVEGAGVIAEKDIFIGDNVTVTVPITCDTLYIEGSNVKLNGLITANKVVINGTMLKMNEIEANVVEIAEGSTNYDGTVTFTTSTGTVMYGDQVLESGIGEISGFKYNIQSNTVSISDPSVTLAIRSKPTWADYSNQEVQVYDMADDGDEWWPQLIRITAGYYTIDTEKVNPVTAEEVVYVDGVATVQEVTWNQISFSWDTYDTTGVSEDNPFCFIIKDGQNVEITSMDNSCFVYFILEGNAKLKLPSGTCKVRVYGEAPSATTYTEIKDGIATIVASYESAAAASGTEVNYSDLQDAIDNFMIPYVDEIATLIVSSGTDLQGNAVVPYVLSTGGDFIWTAEPYDGETLDDSDFENPDYLPSGSGSSDLDIFGNGMIPIYSFTEYIK